MVKEGKHAISVETFQRRAAAVEVTLNKIYDVYTKPDGHFAAGEQEDVAKNVKPLNAIDRGTARSRVWAERCRLPKK